MSAETVTRCLACGFEAPPGDEVWESVQHPPLGELTQCPECGSTDTRQL
jgi:DNA-directed RNA polymerase subunit RPC12/RpoP